MSDYTITTDFGAKDSLPSGNAAKIIKGSEFTTEFTNIKTAVNTKADTTGDTFTGAVTFDAAVTNNAAVTINSTATITGDLTVDTNTLFVDVSENKVGIGTTSPAKTLHISDGTNNTPTTFRIENTDTVIETDQEVNSIEFYTNDSSTSGTGVTAKIAQVAENPGNQYGLAFSTYDAGLEEAMRIDESGKVGIGTTSPAELLHVTGASTAKIQITSTSATGISGVHFGDPDDVNVGRVQYEHATNHMALHTSDTERMRIDSSGNVLVGTTTTDIAQATTETGIVLNNGGWYEGSRDGGTVGYFNRLSNNGEILSFRKDGTTVGSISVTGSATSYNTSSDERLKENIADSADAGSKVDAIQIRQFDWKADGSHQDYGVIAQELLEVAPEAVSEGDTEEDMMGVDYSKLVPMLIKEVQTLRNRVAQLENN